MHPPTYRNQNPDERPRSARTARTVRISGSGEHPVPASATSPTRMPGGFRRYEQRHRLGTGAFGVVYAAHDSALRRMTAIKVLRDTADRAAVESFVEEAQIAGQLEHPNIVPVYELGEDDHGRPYMSMKLVSGETLGEIITRCRKQRRRSTLADLMEDGRLQAIRKVCDALAYAHSRGVIHRDLKPDNVMVGSFGEVLVMDWGLARPINAPDRPPSPVSTTVRAARGSNLTRQGDIIGTPLYMSPEQAMGEIAHLDERTDIFALGATLYEALTTIPPWSARTSNEVLENARRCRAIPPRRRSPALGIPRELDAIARKAMAPDPEDRYQRVDQMAADIDAFLATRPGLAWKDGLPVRLAKWARRNPGWAFGGGVATIAMLLLALGITIAVRTLEAEKARGVELARQNAEEQQKAAEAESKRLVEEQKRLQAERMTEYQAHQARMAELEHMAREGQLAELAELLGGKVQSAAQRARDDFQKLWNEARARGENDQQFVASLGQQKILDTIQALIAVVESSEHLGNQLHTATDLNWLGILYKMGLNDPTQALRWFKKASEMDPTLGAPKINSVECMRMMGRMDDALQALDTLIDRDQQVVLDARARALSHYIRGTIYMGRNDFAHATTDFTTVVRLNPDYAEAWVNRANIKFKSGDYAGALEDARQATEANPAVFQGWVNMGLAQHAMGNMTGAQDSMHRAWRTVADPTVRAQLEDDMRRMGLPTPQGPH